MHPSNIHQSNSVILVPPKENLKFLKAASDQMANDGLQIIWNSQYPILHKYLRAQIKARKNLFTRVFL